MPPGAFNSESANRVPYPATKPGPQIKKGAGLGPRPLFMTLR